MGAILDSLIKYKALEEAQNDDIDAVPQALANFQTAYQNAQLLRQRNIMFELEKKKTEAEIVKLTSEATKSQMEANILGSYNPEEGTTGENLLAKGMLSKLTGAPFEEFLSPEEKVQRAQQKGMEEAVQADLKPLAGESAIRYAGAIQGIQNVENIRGELGKFDLDKNAKLEEDEVKKAKNVIYRANLGVSAASAQDTWIPMAKGTYQRIQRWRAGDKGLNLGKEFLTLSENLLRARTGATAPEPEVVREYARTLLDSFIESPTTWAEKLQLDFNFLQGVAKEIRPMRESEWGGKASTGKTKSGVPFSYKKLSK